METDAASNSTFYDLQATDKKWNCYIHSMILNEIALRVPWYTPEWRYNPDSPDAAAALAFIWADMFAGTIKRYEWLPDNYHRALLDKLGSEPLPAVHARGWLTFNVRDEAEGAVIPVGTAVSAPSNLDVAMSTNYDLTAEPSKITDIYCSLPKTDAVMRYNALTDLELFKVYDTSEHIWTFSHSFAFDVSRNANLKIVPLLNGAIDILATAAWEFLDGESWRGLPVELEGLSLVCKLPRDKTSPCSTIRVTLTHSEAQDLELQAIVAKPSGQGLFADAIYVSDTQETDVFFPFGRRFLPGNCVYFSCLDALTKPGAVIEMSFTLSYENFEIEGYQETEIRLKKLMRVSDFTPPEEYEVTVSEIKWEYYNGIGWAVLDTESSVGIFNGRSHGRMKISFICPSDLKSAVVGAHDLPFIRARLVTADNLFRRRGHYKAPILSNLRFAYHFFDAVLITDVHVYEHLDERDVKLPARLCNPPTGPAALYFAFNRQFRQGSILFDLTQGETPPDMRWEYLNNTGWAALGVYDNTATLSKTGIMSYQVSAPAVKSRLWGHNSYWIRLSCEGVSFGDIQNRPVLRGIYENTVPATAITPGEASVMPANAYTTLSSPIANVLNAYNPTATFGGANAETEERIISRLSSVLSHRGRAVTAGDYESIAMEASTQIQSAKYYPHTDTDGNKAYGEACLVLLPKTTVLTGFNELRDEVAEYISSRCAIGTERLHIIQPRYITVSVYTHVSIENPNNFLSVKNQINKSLEDMLSGTGWTIGQLPTPGQIDGVIRAVQRVVYVIKTKVTYTMENISTDYSHAVTEAFALPLNGQHEIVFDG